MEREKVYQMTNDFGRNYLESWHKNEEFLGVEELTQNSREEFFLVYKYSNGDVCVCVLPMAHTENNGCCSFGDLRYFAMGFAGEETNVNLRLGNNGYFIWPWWYVGEDDYLRWHKIYKEIMDKYS